MNDFIITQTTYAAILYSSSRRLNTLYRIKLNLWTRALRPHEKLISAATELPTRVRLVYTRKEIFQFSEWSVHKPPFCKTKTAVATPRV